MIVFFTGMAILIFFVIKLLQHDMKTNDIRFNTVRAEIISEEPEIKRVTEKDGYSVGYGKHLSYHEHYRYKDVVTGYKVKFKLHLKGGGTRIVECHKDDLIYKQLITKC